MTPLDPDRTLALSYVPASRRAAVSALWHLDAALGAVVANAREPMLGEIKLVWWRDMLAKLDSAPAPAEPTLRAVAEHVLPLGIGGAELAPLAGPWTILFGAEALLSEDLDAYAAGRGGALFRLTAQLLGLAATDEQAKAGEVWALVDLARHSGSPDSEAALAAARSRPLPSHWPARLRPLGMLAVLAARDLVGPMEIQGSPGRMLRMLRHRLTGR